MTEQNKQTVYEKLGIPRQIEIQKEIYTFKVQLINSYVSYRCIHHACKSSVKITIENAKKLFRKDNVQSYVEIIYVGEYNNHPIEVINQK